MHRHFSPRSTQLKQGIFTPMRLCCPHHQRYCIPLRLLTRHRPGFRSNVLIPRLPRTADPRPREISLVALMAFPAFRSPYAGGFLKAALPDSSPLPWPSRCMKRSAPSCSPCGVNISALQDSLYGTDYWFALPSQEDTALHHTRSPRYSGSLLRGSLAITAAELTPASHQNLSRHTNRLLAASAVACKPRDCILEEDPVIERFIMNELVEKNLPRANR